MRRIFAFALIACLFTPLWTLAQAPVADFSASVTSGCSPLSVQFTDKSTGNPKFWNWDFGNGQLSNIQNPVVGFTPGTYTITLVVRNENGVNSITKTNFIVSNPSPSPNLKADRTLACLPATISFTDLSTPGTGTITSWSWGFDDQTTSTVQNPVHSYSQIGYYGIYLKVTNSAGCSAETYFGRYIRVVNGVKANFDYTGPTTCQPPFVLNMKNLTSGPGNLTYSWDFGNSTNSTLTSPSATYTSGGNYTIKLKAQSDLGCSDSIQKSVPINGITGSFTAPASVCLGAAANFQVNSNPLPVKVLWKFGDGSVSSQFNPTKTYAAPGTYTVTLLSTFGSCTDSVSKSIVVAGKPTVNFSSPKNYSCKPPLTVTFQNLSPDYASANWTFGDGGTSNSAAPSVTHTYASAASSDVSLTIVDSKGCTNTISRPSFVNIFAPNVNIGNLPGGVCVGQSFAPVANVGTVDPVASYLWDFGDGTTSTSASPSHNYSSAGTRTVKLTITTGDGCTATATASIQVGTPPSVDFAASKASACHSDAISFTNLSTPAGNTVVNWDFGDGQTSTLAAPSHKFSDTGYFNVKLLVSSNGCVDSITKMGIVRVLPPIANWGYKADCADKRIVSFIDSSKNDPAIGPLTFEWGFGDGSPLVNTQNPTHTYAVANSYTAQLIVSNGTCSDTLVKGVNIATDKADFILSKDTVCSQQRIEFVPVNAPSSIAKYEWVIDGGAPIPIPYNGSYASRYYAGPHTVQFIRTGTDGCVDSSAVKGFFVDSATAAFSITGTGACRNAVLTFTDASGSTGGTIKTWAFDFGDSVQKQFTAPPFTHRYSDTGLYTVSLTVTDNFGCTSTLQKQNIASITAPTAAFGTEFPTFCAGVPLQFLDSSLGKKLTYQWDFGDGTPPGLTQNPIHQYNSNDTSFTVKLLITDSVGCVDSSVRTSYIKIRSPKPAYLVKDTVTLCPPLQTDFKFTGKDVQSIVWDFGDGTPTSTEDSTPHFYNNYGNFTAKLYAYGFGGCVDSLPINIKVINPYTNTQVTFDPKTACNELTVNFNVSTPFGTSFTLYYGDGGADTSQQTTLQHFYPTPNLYSPSILLKDSTGCQAYFGGFGNVDIKGAIPIFGIDRRAFCDSGNVFFTNYSLDGRDPISTTTWDFNDGSGTLTGKTVPPHYYAQPGLFIPALTVTTAAGCSKTFTDTIRVLATPRPVITSADAICRNLVLDLAGSILNPPDTAITWKWTISDGQSSSLQNFQASFKDTGLYTIKLETANSLGCKHDTSKTVVVNPLPSIRVTGDTTIVAGAGGTVMPITYSANATTWNWTPSTGLSCTDCANPLVNPKFSTVYSVKVTDANGCISSRNVQIIVVCNEKNFFIPNTFSPNNDGTNDRFYPRGTGLDRIQAMRIFNRWGELVFEKRNFPANDAASGWDGSYKGKPGASDTYIYMIDIICENANIITYKGNVTLIR